MILTGWGQSITKGNEWREVAWNREMGRNVDRGSWLIMGGDLG